MDSGHMTLMNKPRILVFAGPNGSGKSTITDCYDLEGLYINAVDIKHKQKHRRRRCFCLAALLAARGQ